jgi:hypothetical protein
MRVCSKLYSFPIPNLSGLSRKEVFQTVPQSGPELLDSCLKFSCKHQLSKAGPLAEGIVSGHSVVCPLHAWKVDLETGAVGNQASPVACFASFPTESLSCRFR